MAQIIFVHVLEKLIFLKIVNADFLVYFIELNSMYIYSIFRINSQLSSKFGRIKVYSFKISSFVWKFVKQH